MKNTNSKIMKITILKIPIILLFLTISFSSCNKNNDNEDVVCSSIYNFERCAFVEYLYHGGSSTILGKWKLVAVGCCAHSPTPECIDYCQHNIVFEFKLNNVLTVSGNIELAYLDRFKEGDNFYEDINMLNYRAFKIESSIYSNVFNYYLYWFDTKRLILMKQSDGPSYYFIKIK